MKIKLLLLVALIVSFLAGCGGTYYRDTGYDTYYPRQNVTNKYYINPTPKPTTKIWTKKATPKPKATPKKYTIKKKPTTTKKKVDLRKRR